MVDLRAERVAYEIADTDYGIIPDRSGEIIGRGMASAASTVAAGLNGLASAYDKYKADQEKREAEAIQNEVNTFVQGTNDAILNPFVGPGEQQTIPEDKTIAQGQARMDKLTRARNGGMITETHYASMLYKHMREMKAKYPDKIAEIDAAYMKATGKRPANYLMQEIRSEMRSEQSEQEKTRRDLVDIVSRNPEAAVYFSDVIENPMDSSDDRVREAVRFANATELNKAKRAEIREDFKFGREVESWRKEEVLADTGRLMATGNQNLWTQFLQREGINSKAEYIKAIRDPNNREYIRDLAQNAKMLRLELANGWRVKLQNDGFSAQEADQAIDTNFKYMDDQIALIAGDSDLSFLADDAFTLQNAKTRNQYTAQKLVGLYGAIADLAGAENLSYILKNYSVDGDGVKVQQKIAATVAMSVLDGDAVVNGIPLLNQESKGRPDVAKYTLETVGNLITSPNMYENKPEEFRKLVNEWYDPARLMNSFDGASQVQVYKLMSRPDIIQAVINTKDDQLIKKVGTFMTEAWSSMGGLREMGTNMKRNLGDIQDMVTTGINEDGTIVVGFDEDGYEQMKEGKGNLWIERKLRSFQELQGNLAKMNPLLSNYGTWLEANGMPIQEHVEFALMSTGGSPTDTNTWNWLLDTVADGFDALTNNNVVTLDSLIAREEQLKRNQFYSPNAGGSRLDKEKPQEASSSYGGDMGEGQDMTVETARSGVMVGKPKDQWRWDYMKSDEDVKTFRSAPADIKAEMAVRSDPATVSNAPVTPEDATEVAREVGAVDPVAAGAAKTPMELSRALIGYSEKNPEQNEVLAAFIKRHSGININPATTAWCAAYVNGVLGAQGSEGTGKLNARSFLNWGTPVQKPEKGDVVVFSRGDPNGWQGHVGFFQGYDANGNILVLGGNQANAVNIKAYSADRLLGFRRGTAVA